MKLRLVLRVVDLLIARDDHDDRLVAELEAHGLGDARALDADGDGRQLHRGAGNVELADTAGDAEALKIGSYFSMDMAFPLFLLSVYRTSTRSTPTQRPVSLSSEKTAPCSLHGPSGAR